MVRHLVKITLTSNYLSVQCHVLLSMYGSRASRLNHNGLGKSGPHLEVRNSRSTNKRNVQKEVEPLQYFDVHE